MMKKAIDCFVVLLLAMTAAGEGYAQEKVEPVCQILERHVPADNVAYQPGVDVYGNAVVPADLNAAPNFVPEVIKVPISVDLAKRMGGLPDGIQMEAPLGMLEIQANGHVRYNGQDLTAPVMTLCGESHKVVEEQEVVEAPALEPVTQDDRLPAPDVIKSEAVEVQPTQALPPQDVTIGEVEVEPEEAPETKPKTSDVIEGGDYREIYYND